MKINYKIWIAITATGFILAACHSQQGVTTAKNKPVKQLIAGTLSGETAPKEKSYIYLDPVHFPFASDKLLKEELSVLAVSIDWLKKNPDAVVVLEGHCDEHGDDYYNMQLGDHRARRIKTYLIKEGIEEDRLIMVVSYGERRPKDPRHTPGAWRANRRVEFIVR